MTLIGLAADQALGVPSIDVLHFSVDKQGFHHADGG